MGNVVLNGATSGQITLQPAAVAGTNTLTLPAATDTLVGKATTDTLTNKTLTSPTITGASMSSMASSVLTSGTSQASTSGTSIDFTSIPSWVKRITVMFSGVSTSGTSNLQVQVGAGSITSSGYLGGAWTANTYNVTFTAAFGLTAVNAATRTYSGSMVITLLGSNTWTATSALYDHSAGNNSNFSAGSVPLSGTLDRVRITTVNGTDTFDAGNINIIYE